MCKAAALSTVALTLLAGLSCLGLKLPSVEVAATKKIRYFQRFGPVDQFSLSQLPRSGFLDLNMLQDLVTSLNFVL